MGILVQVTYEGEGCSWQKGRRGYRIRQGEKQECGLDWSLALAGFHRETLEHKLAHMLVTPEARPGQSVTGQELGKGFEGVLPPR